MAKRQNTKVPHGEDYLESIESLTLRLEDGVEATFKIADELRIPNDLILIEAEAKRGSARLAFWEYQAERALRKVREHELKVERIEGAADHTYRQMFVDTEGDYREGMVRAGVKNDKDVTAAKRKLMMARKQYGFVKVVANAVRNRCFVLDRLLANAFKELG